MKSKKLIFPLALSCAVLSLVGCTTKNNDTKKDDDKGEVTKYTVTFDTNGGNAINPQSVDSGAKATAETPTRTGYTFVGWYTDAALTNEFNFNTAINANITLYAKWTEAQIDTQKFTVTFNTNGGTQVASQTLASGTAISGVTTTKSGCTFAGWYTDAALTQLFDVTTKITANITLYAKWTENAGPSNPTDPVTNCTVTFNTNGGSSVASQTVASGSVLTNLTVPTKSGNTFAGWYTDASLTTLFDTNAAITADVALYAKWVAVTQASIVKSVGGYTEGLYATFDETNANGAVFVEYKLSTDSAYKAVDKELIRATDTAGIARVDVVGLPAGNYDLKITNTAAKSETRTSIQVAADDRSGYAHFNHTEGVGAYDDNGKLKPNAVVVYVTDDTKNTVKATIDGKEYVGLANIIKRPITDENGNSIIGEDGKVVGHTYDDLADTPVDIRIIGKVSAATWNSISTNKYSKLTGENTVVKGKNGVALAKQNYTEEELIEAGFNTLNTTVATKLNGLTNKIKWDASKGEFDSYYNMLDASYVKNITVEGIGTDAEIFQWGFTWKGCSNVEVKNLTFNDYTEDACSAEGYEDSTTIAGFKSGHIWIHQNTFNIGVNYWDVCSEQDKHDGDGSTDFKKNAFITVSYNHYYKCHKTGLVGGSDSQKTACLTYHHNWYDTCGSRLPFARQANMHMYNNYYDGSTGTNMQIYAGAYAFIENCYFRSANKPMEMKTSDGKVAAAKLFNNVFDSCSGTNGGTVVTSRTQTVANGNLYGQTFDTNSSIFYYDSTNQVSKVSIMLDTYDVKDIIPQVAGAGLCKDIVKAQATTSVKHTVTFNSNGGSDVSPVEVKEGTSPLSLPAPTKSGYEFAGWYSDAALTTAFTTSTVVNADITVYAKWAVSSKVTATYHENTAAPTEAGLYFTSLVSSAAVEAGKVGSDTSVVEENGVITVTDTSGTATTVGYLVLDSDKTYSTGKVTYSMTFTTGDGVGGKWNPIRFLDAAGNELLAIRMAGPVETSSSSVYISYTTGGDDTTETIVSKTKWLAKTTYTVSLAVDYDNDTAVLTITQGSNVYKSESIAFTGNIKTLKFFTAASASNRSFTVKDIEVIKA